MNVSVIVFPSLSLVPVRGISKKPRRGLPPFRGFFSARYGRGKAALTSPVCPSNDRPEPPRLGVSACPTRLGAGAYSNTMAAKGPYGFDELQTALNYFTQ